MAQTGLIFEFNGLKCLVCIQLVCLIARSDHLKAGQKMCLKSLMFGFWVFGIQMVTVVGPERAMWDKVKGPPPDLKGKIPFTPYSGFTLGTPVFTHYTSARWRYFG